MAGKSYCDTITKATHYAETGCIIYKVCFVANIAPFVIRSEQCNQTDKHNILFMDTYIRKSTCLNVVYVTGCTGRRLCSFHQSLKCDAGIKGLS
jgi:hypothetical protein